jgi:hypothetical protein
VFLEFGFSCPVLCGSDQVVANLSSTFVGKSWFAGKGLFAGTRIRARAKIGEYEGERISLAGARRRARGLKIVAIVEPMGMPPTRRAGSTASASSITGDPNTFFRCTPVRAEVYAPRDPGRRGNSPATTARASTTASSLPRGAANCRGFI